MMPTTIASSMPDTLMPAVSMQATKPKPSVALVEVAYCSVLLAMNQLPLVCARHALKANIHLLEASVRLVPQAPLPTLTALHVTNALITRGRSLEVTV